MQYKDAFRTAVMLVCDALREEGWEQLDEGHPNYARFIFTDPISHRPKVGTCYTREYKTYHGVSRVLCHDRLRVHPEQLVLQTIQSGQRFEPAIRLWRLPGSPGHPHALADGQTVCYHVPPRYWGDEEYGTPLTQAVAQAVGAYVATFTCKFHETDNPASIGNTTRWNRCRTCNKIDYIPNGLWCAVCGGFWCSACKGPHCPVCPAPLETPAGLAPWQFIAKTMQWPACDARYAAACLVGCGVTGSWAAPVLNRTFATVHAFDPGILEHPALVATDHINRSGLWGPPAATTGFRKVNGIERQVRLVTARNGQLQRREQVYLNAHPLAPGTRASARFDGTNVPVGLDLLVLCPDTAGARLLARPDMAGRVLDVRGTPTSCVFWALPGRPRPGGGRHPGLPPGGAWRANTHPGWVCLSPFTPGGGCRHRFELGEDMYEWGEAATGHVACRTCVNTHWPPVLLPVPPAPLTADELDLWAQWHTSLDGYLPDETARCEDHHDAVSLDAGTTTARFLSQWISQEMPTGVWEVTFKIGRMEEVHETETRAATV